MMIALHKNATTTPGIRQRPSVGDEPASVLALRDGLSGETARKSKRRDSVQDLSGTPHTLQTTRCKQSHGLAAQESRQSAQEPQDL
jgi:hypothetical protein